MFSKYTTPATSSAAVVCGSAQSPEHPQLQQAKLDSIERIRVQPVVQQHHTHQYETYEPLALKNL